MKSEIYTRSMNWKLYKLSSKTVTLPFKKNRCRFTSADGYFYQNIMKSSADIILNIDEDAFVTDNKRLKDLLEFFIDNDYVNCGVPDGGVMDIRKHNPLVTNPFFNIMNVKKIREQFSIENINKNYTVHHPQYENFTPNHLLKSKYEYDFFEPYVPFFLWLATNFKTLYLDAVEHEDSLSNKVLDQNGNSFLLHSWYSRFYSKDIFHTERINNLYREATDQEVPTHWTFLDKIIEKNDQFGTKFHPLKSRIMTKLRI